MKTAIGLAALALATLIALPANAADTIKIGLIMPYSGQFADTATQMDNAIKLFMKENGDTVAGKKIELIRKDVGGINPALAKRLAQELIVRDHVDVLAGFVLTPNALAAGDVSKQTKKFMVVMNAATAVIVQKSPYMTRTSSTTPQLNQTLGTWAAKQGIKSVFTMVSNYGPGLDAQKAFERGFTGGGGKIVGSTAFPTDNPDFSSFIKRAKDSKADAIYVWVPGGAQPGAVGKAIAEQGIDPMKTKVLGQDVLTDDHALKSMGSIAQGVISVWNYNYNLKTPENAKFLSDYRKAYNRNPDIFSIGGWDGMRLIYAALTKTGGKTDGEVLINAVKGMKWMSPRGPVSIDPATRDIVQNVYIFKVEKTGGGFNNVLIDTVENVKTPTN
jgi:branched-chain amino acid transport system substrate-binding protein